jgi:DNA-binding NarL/FixJ family response regulator
MISLSPPSEASDSQLRCLIVDPLSLPRAGVARLVEDLGAGTEVREAGSLSEALAVMREGIDLVLLDASIGRDEEFTSVRLFKAASGETPVVVMADGADPIFIGRALAAGANGFIPRTTTPRLFLGAIRFVIETGGPYLPREVLASPQDEPRPEREAVRPAPSPSPSAPPPSAAIGASPAWDVRLTSRQRDVLALVARGRSNREIGEALGIAEGTAKLHVASVLKALGAQNRTEAALLARSAGGVTGP